MYDVSTELFVIQVRYYFPGSRPGRYPEEPEFEKYFEYVQEAEKNIQYFEFSIKKKTHFLTIGKGDLNKIQLNKISQFLKSDLYIVFGSSYIKGDLVKFLIKNKAINIHMGVHHSIENRLQFWAVFDGKYDYVGSTIHLLSEGLDSGPMLYHALSEAISDPFIYTMSTVKSAFKSLKEN